MLSLETMPGSVIQFGHLNLTYGGHLGDTGVPETISLHEQIFKDTAWGHVKLGWVYFILYISA